jgi:uncharacterized lipoprotein YbaY
MNLNLWPQIIGMGLATISLGGATSGAAALTTTPLAQPLQPNCLTQKVPAAETQAWCVSQLTQMPETEERMEQLEGTLFFAQTSSYAVRVYNTEGQLQINLHNKQTGITELLGASAVMEMTDTGVRYQHGGDLPVTVAIAPSGEPEITVNGTTLEDYETVTGTVFYLPRIALPQHAVVEISLVDVSRADAPAITIATQQLITAGQQVPIPFTMMYDPAQIDPRFSYAVQARIAVDGELQFISTSNVPVITRDNPTTDVAVKVDLVDPAPVVDTPSLTNTVWQLQHIQYNNDTLLEASDPEHYTIEFLDDGQLSIRADCNQVLGTYTVDESSLAIALGPTTLAACPPESIDQEYLQALQGAAIYFFEEGDLLIDLKFDTGIMRFSAAN